jgi:hypothetical protein
MAFRHRRLRQGSDTRAYILLRPLCCAHIVLGESTKALISGRRTPELRVFFHLSRLAC